MRRLAVLLTIAIAVPALAQDVPMPRVRPADPIAPISTEPVAAEPAVPMPRPRPRTEAKEPPLPSASEPAPVSPAVTDEAVPELPPRVYQAACPALLSGKVEARALEPIEEGACGERSPLGVTGVLVHGRMVPLSSEATVSCGMAETLPEWTEAIDGYLMAREDTRLARILVGTSYMCRNRNNATSGNLSEHGFANALDVVGFELEDGRTITLPDGWTDPLAPAGRLLRFAHDAGCARFTTTLGPEANALHEDHLHLDLGCHGKTCTARLCE